jgi:hypothetical protein
MEKTCFNSPRDKISLEKKVREEKINLESCQFRTRSCIKRAASPGVDATTFSD